MSQLKGSANGQAIWEDFCERLKRAGGVFDRPTTPRDDFTLAEGLRKLVHFIRVGFEASVEYADTEHPRVYQSVTPTTLGEGETSDAVYHQAFIDGAATYRVTGDRGMAPLIEFTVYAGKIGLQDVSRQVGALTEQDLRVNADGSFDLVLSPESHPGNWIRTEPEATLLYIRQYAHDWRNVRSATFDIRREGQVTPPPPLQLDTVCAGLDRTAAFVERAVRFWAGIADLRAAAEPNIFYEIPADPDPERPSMVPAGHRFSEMPAGHRFSGGYFRVAPDEALVLRFTPTEVPYWGVAFTNYWLEPPSYEDHRSHVNNRTATYDPDGSVRIVISGERRGAANWIDTLGHRQGMMLLRWSRSQAPVPPIRTELVKLHEL
jgi:hypothetical protein